MTSRTAFALLFATGLAFALGCGGDSASKPAASTENPKPPEQPTPETPTTPKTESPKAVHELDQTKHVIPAAPVRGSIAGVEATPTVNIVGDELTFSVFKPGKPEADRSIKVKLVPVRLNDDPVQVLGHTWKVKLGESLPNSPHVWLEVDGKKGQLFDVTAYAMTLELEPLKDQKVTGKIYLSLKDEQQTFIAGTFTTDYTRSVSEWPTPQEAPYIRGEVLVTGLKEKDQVRVAFARFVDDKMEADELQGPCDPDPLEFADWTSNGAKTSRLIFGDGKARPYRYEHTKLQPGRYLISAAVVDGPVVWKWLDLPANGMLTENFTIDATKTGGVEVTVPMGVTGRVFVAPASEAGKPALNADLFQAVAVQVVRQDAGIVAGKALVKSLAPGKYEVRVGELKGNVEIVAGKTAELTLK